MRTGNPKRKSSFVTNDSVFEPTHSSVPMISERRILTRPFFVPGLIHVSRIYFIRNQKSLP